MSSCTLFNEFKHETDKLESLYTVVVCKSDRELIVNHFIKKLKIIGMIRDSYKKTYLLAIKVNGVFNELFL